MEETTQNESDAPETTQVTEQNAETPQADIQPDGGEDAAFTPDDGMIERAVRAGMSLSDAKSIPSKEMFERFVGVLEKGNGRSEPTNAEGGDGDEIPALDLSDLTEELGYDPTLVSKLNAIKGIVDRQAKLIAKLSAGNTPKARTAAAETRRNLTLARPGGETGSRKTTPASAEAQILSELRSKFKLN